MVVLNFGGSLLSDLLKVTIGFPFLSGLVLDPLSDILRAFKVDEFGVGQLWP